MISTADDFKARIAQPLNKVAIAEMVKQEEWLQCLTLGTNKHLFLNKCRELLHPSLHSVIAQQFHVYSPSFLSTDDGIVYTNYQKVFNTREGVAYEPTFSDGNELTDFLEYTNRCYLTNAENLNKGVGQRKFYETQLIKDILYAPNTRYIIDFASVSRETLPTVSRILAREIHDLQEYNGKTEYIIVRKEYGSETKTSPIQPINSPQEKDRYKYNLQTWYYCYSESLFCLWVNYQQGNKYELKSEVANSLGYTPCVAASDYYLQANTDIIRKSPITTALPDIEWWNIATNFYNYHFLQKQIPPSISIANNSCNNTFEGSRCENGYFALPRYNMNGEVVIGQYNYVACPKCEERKKSKFTFGKEVTIDYEHIFPQGVNATPRPEVLSILKESLGSIPTSIEFAKIGKEILEGEKQNILNSVIGNAFNTLQSREAFTEKYIQASLDDRRNNLVNFANKIEQTWEFIDSTIAKARYITFEGINVYLGREYFFKTLLEYQTELTQLIKGSGDVYMIAKKQLEIAQSEYGQYDKMQLAFYKALSTFMPFQDLTIEQVIANKDVLASLGDDYKKRVLLRINGVELVNKFIHTVLPKYWQSVINPNIFIKKTERWFYAQLEKQSVSRETVKNTPIIPNQNKVFNHGTYKKNSR